MPEKLGYLDCCNEPLLETVRHLRKSSHETESIRRCRQCGQQWYYVIHESRHRGESLDYVVWCSRLTAEEATLLANAPHQERHKLVDQKVGILRDDEGVRKDARRPQLGGTAG
jgi:hypothetical protein